MSTWPLQKLKNFTPTREKKSDCYLEQMKWPRTAQIKYDGRHTTIIVDCFGKVKYYTSSGKMFELMDDQIFGEATTPEGVYFAEMNGHGSNGKLGRRVDAAVQLTYVTNTKKGLFNMGTPTFRVFDYVTKEEFDIGECTMEFLNRWSWLKTKLPTTVLAEEMECENLEHLEWFMERTIKAGYEGVVHTWEGTTWIGKSTRRPDAAKWKRRPTADLLCTEELGGEGKYEGMIGSLRCVDGNGIERCLVGSGLNDTLRGSHGHFVGKIIEVEYEQVMSERLIQPIFVTVRDDKTEAEEL